MTAGSPTSGRTLVFALALLAGALAAAPAAAFHDGGVASCQGCHVMHESEDGLTVTVGDIALLRGPSATDVCLSCHAGMDSGVLGEDPLAPPPELGAGNFVFLRAANLNDGYDSTTNPIGGFHAGHSVVAPGYGLEADPDFTTAPGGTFPSSQLGCTSCHDPHGNGNFRMLNGAGPVQDGLYTFLYPAPDAEGLPLTGTGLAEGPAVHTAYRSGMSLWCANCHGMYHEIVGTQVFQHGFDVDLSGGDANRYDAYRGDADPTGGDHATSYLPEVPFEDPAATTDSTAGPGPGAKVMCLTCHRAHATSGPGAGRWDFFVKKLADDGLATGTWPIPSPYVDPDQGQLCLKCHDVHHGSGSQFTCVSCHANSQRDTGGVTPGG